MSICMQIVLGHVVPTYLPSEGVLDALAVDGQATLMSLAGTDVIASMVVCLPCSTNA